MALFRDFLAFLATHKRWWLTPIALVLLLLLALVLEGGGSGSTPFTYTMF